MIRKRLLFVGDAACPSGFARATHNYIKALDYREDGGGDFEVTVLGINYRGDPDAHRLYPYDIYVASAEGDAYGIERLIWMCDLVKPDVIVLQNDPWNFPHYINRLKHFPEYDTVPVVGIVAVDGQNCNGRALKGLTLAVFWTRFGMDEARKGGYDGPACVIPLGVDLDIYKPMPRREARALAGLPEELADAFIVGNVNRNQPRKRWDLTLRYFAKWAHSGPLKNAYLYMHVAPTGDTGIDVDGLARYYGIYRRVITASPPTFYGYGEDRMAATYNAFDVQVSTTQGEGFGLTTFEGMACGVPQVVPGWSALGELCVGAASLVPCTSTAVGPPYVNVVGGVADEVAFVRALDALYKDRKARAALREAGLRRVAEERFRWPNVGYAFRLVVGIVLRGIEEKRVKLALEARAERAEMERVARGLGGARPELEHA